MKLKPFIVLSVTVLLMPLSRRTWAAPPPVQVEVLDQNAADFFSEAPGEGLKTEAVTGSAVADGVATSSAVAETRPATLVQASTRPPQSDTWELWWDRPRGLAAGDALVEYSIGGWSGGIYNGLGFEGLVTDRLGIVLSAKIASVGTDEDGHIQPWRNRGDWDLFLAGRSVAPSAPDGTSVDHAFLHLETLAASMHFGDGSGIDLAPSLGVSHFGYHIGVRDHENLNGGSGFLSAGVKVAWIYKRLYAGVDLGWYPVELFRYGLVKKGESELEFAKRSTGDVTDPRRFMASLAVGISL